MSLTSINYSPGEDTMEEVFDKTNDIIAAVNNASGGSAGEYLRKVSGTDFDFEYGDPNEIEAWSTVSAYTSSDISAGTAKYRKDNTGKVTIKGSITFDSAVSTATQVLFTLPSGYRPVETAGFAINIQKNGVSPIVILKALATVSSAGVVTLLLDNAHTEANSATVYLNDISFYID
jgi:hypothetical protein